MTTVINEKTAVLRILTDKRRDEAYQGCQTQQIITCYRF